MKEKAYYEEVRDENELRLRDLLSELPPFCKQYFISLEATTSSRTRIAYAYDIGCFFNFIHDKNIVRLDVDEVALLLDQVESGEELTEKQKKYHEKTKTRDLALLTLMLGTGIRVSECVGLDLTDVDFKNNGIRIHRKGGKEVVVYFGDEVREALLSYLEERKLIVAEPGSTNALFLSLQNKRISVRSVENLVKKYTKPVTPLKNITPHKLRSTYGTTLYRETDDIYLVADVLGHTDVNTTRRHYAEQAEDRRRSAANRVKLREP